MELLSWLIFLISVASIKCIRTVKGNTDRFKASERGAKCENGFGLIRDQNLCNDAAKKLVNNSLQFKHWEDTSRNNFDAFLHGNTFTKGCYWQVGRKSHLYFNPYGIDEPRNNEIRLCEKLIQL